MFDFITGKIDYIHREYIVVESNGIGYQIYCPNAFIYQEKTDSVKVYTYYYVREDATLLYGFQSREEKALFTKLLSVSGIGPKGGLAILATGEPDQVIMAIEQEDETFLTKFPGVGKKTARQMILDLKGKLDELVVAGKGETYTDQKEKLEISALHEAVEALKALGYADKEIKKITPQLENESLTTDALIKRALQLLIHQ